ncbi:putative aldo-keto reductase 6 [Quercus suber]|uniref:Aldo-keto reductase 6 n=1 Tax=Quercus suber TaxID=58331 RepID=A0AAW0JJL5_QUESU
MKRLRQRERKRFVRMKMKNRTSERMAIGEEKSSKEGMHPITISTSLRSSPREDVCPIPGTAKIVNFNQNIGVVSMKLTTKEMVEFESFFSEDLIMDDRYMHDLVTWKDSETPSIS